jgi:hypothetical protein
MRAYLLQFVRALIPLLLVLLAIIAVAYRPYNRKCRVVPVDQSDPVESTMYPGGMRVVSPSVHCFKCHELNSQHKLSVSL